MASTWVDLKTYILDLAHPVGCYYWSSNSTSPETLFGGTWEQVTEKFIFAAGDNYSQGSNGGALSHAHLLPFGFTEGGTLYGWRNSIDLPAFDSGVVGADYNAYYASNRSNGPIRIAYTQALSSMPPYEVAYCWKRTA